MSPNPSLPDSLRRALRATRRRRLALAGIETFGFAALGLSFLCVVAAIIEPTPAARAGAWALLVASLSLPAVGVLLPVLLRTRSAAALAGAIDDRAASLGGALRAALDLAPLARSGAGRSAELAKLHLEAADASAGELDPRALVPLDVVRRPAWLGLPALAFALLAMGPESAGDRIATLLGGHVSAEAATGEAAEVPGLVLANLAITLQPPSYSGRAEARLEGTSGDFLALPGTHVVIEADGAGLRSPRAFLGEQPVSAELVDGRLRVVFETTRAVWWQVETPRPLGEPLRTRRFRIEVLPDRPPVIEVSGGVAQIELSPGDGLPLSIRASDDFGLRTVSRVVSADAGEWSRTVLSEPGAAAAELDDRFVAPDPGPPDGVFELRYEACDNDAVSGSKCTASRPIRVTMPTVAGRHQRTLANKEALLDRALDWLSDLVLTVAAGAPTDRDATIADHERHISLRAPWVQAAAALIEAQAADRLESGRNQAGIATLVDNVERRWKAVDDALDEGARRWKQPRLAPVHGRHIGEARSGLRDELERAVLDLAAFVDLQRGDELVGDLAEASQASAEMKDLLRQVADGKPLAAELKAALDKLRARLRDVARELAQRRGGPDDSFVNQMPSQLGEDTLAEIERAIAEGRIDDAMRLMEEADRALAQLGDQLATESASFAGGSGSAQRDRELQAAIEQTKRLEERQQQVAEEVGRLAEQQGTGPQDEALLAEATRLREAAGRLADRPGEGAAMPRRLLEQSTSALHRLESALAEHDLRDAAAEADDARELMAGAGEGLARDGRPHAADARALSRDIARLGEKVRAAEQAEENARRRAARNAEGPAGRQAGVRGDTGALGESLEKAGGSAWNPASVRDELGMAEQMMENAEQSMRQGETGRGASSARDAAQRLRSVREGLEATQEALRQAGHAVPGAADGRRPRLDGQPGESVDEVVMPDPDEFVGPESLRRLLLEGASSEVPGRYRPLHGSYYQELAR